MSDPRFTDPRYSDPRRPPESDPAAMRRFDLERNSGAMWGWAAAIFALIVVMAMVIGYNRSGTIATNSPDVQNAPSTTGAAPPPPTPRTRADQAAPTLTQPPASKPAESEPAPAPGPAQKQP